MHRVQPGEYRASHEPLDCDSLGVHRNIDDAVEHGEREQARRQHEQTRSQGRTQQRAREHEQRGGQGPPTPGARHHETSELETENGAGFQAEEGDRELSVAQAQAVLDGRYA